MFTLLSLQADSLTAATSTAVIENVAPNTEISVLEFILKGGFFLIPIAILLLYTFYVIAERYLYIDRASKIDDRLLRDVGEQLQSGNIELARAIVERSTNASSTIIKEGIKAQKEFAHNVLKGLTEEEKHTCKYVFDKICSNADEYLKKHTE